MHITKQHSWEGLTSYVFLEGAFWWSICWLAEGSESRVTLFRLMSSTSCTRGLYVQVCCTACTNHSRSHAPLEVSRGPC